MTKRFALFSSRWNFAALHERLKEIKFHAPAATPALDVVSIVQFDTGEGSPSGRSPWHLLGTTGGLLSLMEPARRTFYRSTIPWTGLPNVERIPIGERLLMMPKRFIALLSAPEAKLRGSIAIPRSPLIFSSPARRRVIRHAIRSAAISVSPSMSKRSLKPGSRSLWPLTRTSSRVFAGRPWRSAPWPRWSKSNCAVKVLGSWRRVSSFLYQRAGAHGAHGYSHRSRLSREAQRSNSAKK